MQQQRLRWRALQRAEQPLHARRPQRAVDCVDRAQCCTALTRRRYASKQLGRKARPEGRRFTAGEARMPILPRGAAPRHHGSGHASRVTEEATRRDEEALDEFQITRISLHPPTREASSSRRPNFEKPALQPCSPSGLPAAYEGKLGNYRDSTIAMFYSHMPRVQNTG